MTDRACNLSIHPDPEALAQAAAEEVVRCWEETSRRRAQFSVALSGGSTPRPLYELLARDPYASRIDWGRVQVFWADERCVPPDHPDSNYRMACEALLHHVPIPQEQVHRMRGEDPPQQAAQAHEAEMASVLGEDGNLALTILGMGTDGHTASLFPGTDAIDERQRRVVANHLGKLGSWRLTLTLTSLNQSEHVIFLVSGEDKAETLARVMQQYEMDLPPENALPAARIRPGSRPALWLVDEAAASLL